MAEWGYINIEELIDNGATKDREEKKRGKKQKMSQDSGWSGMRKVERKRSLYFAGEFMTAREVDQRSNMGLS